MRQPYEVWLEAEHWAPGQWVPRNTNSDVLVTFADGAKWAAIFFSYENIAALRLKNQETGECLGGRYLWSTNMVLVDEVTRERVEQVVADLIASGEFEVAFDGPTPQLSNQGVKLAALRSIMMSALQVGRLPRRPLASREDCRSLRLRRQVA